MRKLLFFALLLSANAQAGVKELTWHSRANCGNNESITWHLGHSHKLKTSSDHYQCTIRATKNCPWFIHSNETEWENTWRSVIVHWGEPGAISNWYVSGLHKIMDTRGKITTLGVTQVYDCSIYDGWWDQ